MKSATRKKNNSTWVCTIFILIGILVNALFAYLSFRFNLPLFLDTIGTFAVAIAGGYFPGVLTAVMTNTVCSIFNQDAIYFGTVNAAIALVAAEFVSKNNVKTKKNVALLTLYAALISGILGSIIQWRLFFAPQNSFVGDTVEVLASYTGLPAYPIFVIFNIIVNIPDKGIALVLALIAIRFMPAGILEKIKSSIWRQRTLSVSERQTMREWSKGNRHSVRIKMTLIIFGMSFVLVLIVFWIGMKIYTDNMIEQRTLIAENAANFAAEVMPADSIDEFIKKGEEAEGYLETKELLYKIRGNELAVSYLSVVKMSEAGMTYVFDLDYMENGSYMEGYEPGSFSLFPEYLAERKESLLNGEKIDPIMLKDSGGLLVSLYSPVYNDKGLCVSYVIAEARVEYVTSGVRNYVVRIVLMMSGFFFLTLLYGFFVTGANLVYPITSIVLAVEKFISAGGEQKKMDEALKLIRSLDIRTDDEVEKLYFAISDMAANQNEQMRSLRRYTEATSKMQDGLIITMADLVENRDSDTGAHIQKMAAYVKIIVEGLKKKGYYAEKITPQFISDIVRSAPLHDIGKINIPDNVLNKPGKLTPEEYEIMKTHTTAGEKIMAKAISTVEGENYLKEARNMATYHHERWDGKGYPEGLHGEVIPLSARITAVADVFDALTSPRVYKPAFPIEEALAMIEEGSGTQFDPKCVEVFMDALPEVKVILRKYNEGV